MIIGSGSLRRDSLAGRVAVVTGAGEAQSGMKLPIRSRGWAARSSSQKSMRRAAVRLPGVSIASLVQVSRCLYGPTWVTSAV